MIIIDGKKTAEVLYNKLAEEVRKLKNEGKRAPHLAALLIGNNPASKAYVGGKVKACRQVGYESSLIHLPETTTESELLKEIDRLNNDPEIDGFIVQLPLPGEMDEKKITQRIFPEKDVDGFHPVNLGRMLLNLPAFLPATPSGIMTLIKSYGIETKGKHCVVIGRSHIVGSPMSILLASPRNPGNCTVTLCHSHTVNLKSYTQQADIIIVALGKPFFLKGDMVKHGVVVIDVGITRVPDRNTESGYRLAGDADYDDLKDKCSYITPVPGGVGPMTIATLMQNTLAAYKKEIYP